jgi:hypothetical protein
MRRSWIERIREKTKRRQYDMTAHPTEEMAEDDLHKGAEWRQDPEVSCCMYLAVCA